MGIVELSSDIILDGFLKTIQYSVQGGLAVDKKGKRERKRGCSNWSYVIR